MQLSEQEIDIVARTIWGEARGEGMAGMVAVGHVIRNRVESGVTWWGTSPAAVCLKKAQFSCWLKSDPNHPFLSGAKDIPAEQFARCAAAAKQAFADSVDPTGGATHYYAMSISAPAWTAKATFTAQIGSHRFYKDVP
jgi:N-acetylmuramoyl-L-alanine amidase